jgi:hypothetical protein
MLPSSNLLQDEDLPTNGLTNIPTTILLPNMGHVLSNTGQIRNLLCAQSTKSAVCLCRFNGMEHLTWGWVAEQLVVPPV